MCFIGKSELVTDCANVETQSESPRDCQLSFKRMHAGEFAQLLARPERKLISEVSKVKAHLRLNEADTSDDEHARRYGNYAVDLGAKAALRAHPVDVEVVEYADVLIKSAQATCKLAAKLLPFFYAPDGFQRHFIYASGEGPSGPHCPWTSLGAVARSAAVRGLP